MIRVQQRTWTSTQGWSEPSTKLAHEPQLVFIFGDRSLVARENLYEQARQFYPDAYILTASTAGNILGKTVTENSVTVSALHFEKTKIWFSETSVENQFDSKNVGKKLAEFLPKEDLVHSLVLSDGLAVNGTDLVQSINEYLPESVTVTGGLAGDGEDFKETLVGCNAEPSRNRVALIGFYGKSLKVGYASRGGWSASQETYTITKSDTNVLYELNNEPALDIYKRLLGPESEKLPSSALLYPIQIEIPGEGAVVRTILGVDEDSKSMTFAGDMPQDNKVHFMHASEDNLIESARIAGTESTQAIAPAIPQFALLVSCVGRRLVLKDKTVKEIQAVSDAVGKTTPIHGFYSYGELCPGPQSGNKCLLHNQTMTITTFAEI